MNPRPVLSPALAAVRFARPLRNITALHDAGICASTTDHAMRREHARMSALRSGADPARLVTSGFWREENARKAGGCVVSDAKTGVILRRL